MVGGNNRGRTMIKSALVTGAGGGLGRAVALLLAARGCTVAALDIVAAAAEETAAEAGSGLVTPLVMDLTTPGAAERAVEESLEALGGLDIVVNNAGWGIGEAFLEMTEASWDRTLALNLKAVALICAVAGRHMKLRGSGRIVNVTSPASRMALPNYLAYAASKAGVDAVTRAAALALAPFGVRVNSVAPGMMDTAMQIVTERQLATIEGRADVDTFLAERTGRIPIGRRTDVETVAGMIVWLALDAPEYITAERLNVSGGLDRD
jgi:NAD(P)-dependent dehydrogenase (short-subunit alcohol dehydrogenase family)